MNRLITYFLKNYRPLLTSLFLALLLWLAVITDKTYTMRLEVPFAITKLADGYVLTKTVPKTVSLEVSGKGRALISLNFYQPSIDLELTEFRKSGTIQLSDYQKRFHLPRNLGIKIVDILKPRQLTLQVDHLARVRKLIDVQAKIKPSPGYVLSDIVSNTDSVWVSGPRELLKSFTKVSSVQIEKTNIKYPFETHLQLINPGPGIFRLEPDHILVRFVLEQLVERTLYNIPIQIVGVPDDFQASTIPPTITLRVKGSESRISALKQNQVTAIFNYKRMFKEGKMSYSVRVDSPPAVEILDISPKQFRLQLKRNEDIE